MAATDIIFQGLYYAVGYTASVSCCGLDCGDYVVDANGDVTVPIDSDPDGNFNGPYLVQFDVGPFDKLTYGDQTTRIDLSDGVGGIQTIYVPVVIGFTYPSWGAGLRAVGEDQTKSPKGPGLGETRITHWFSALVSSSQGLSFGTTNAGSFYPAAFTDQSNIKLKMNTLFSGVWASPIEDGPSFDGMIAWSVSRPYAATVVALSGFIETSER